MPYTIPIYYGCTNIHDYFPEGSILHIDINDIDESVENIKEAIYSNYYEKNFEALLEARKLYLSKYHFFPCMTYHILNDIAMRGYTSFKPETLCLNPHKQTITNKITNIFKSQLRKLRN